MVRYFLYVDDLVSVNPASVLQFQERFIRGLPQLDPILNALADVLRDIFGRWDDLTASFIISGALKYMAHRWIETSMEKSLPSLPKNSHFATFQRQGSGIGKGYSIFGFSKSSGLNGVDYLHVLPEMGRYIDISNDVLS